MIRCERPSLTKPEICFQVLAPLAIPSRSGAAQSMLIVYGAAISD
jgi:hypothetical protein